MTREEVVKMLGIVKVAYPNFYKQMTREEMLDTVDLWATMFEHEEGTIVLATVKELINNFKFPPTIADVKERMRKITSANKNLEIDYWNELVRIVSNGNYNAQSGFENASEPVKRFLHSPEQIKELARMDSNTFNTVTKGQFLKHINMIINDNKEKEMLLPETKNLIAGLAKQLSIETKA